MELPQYTIWGWYKGGKGWVVMTRLRTREGTQKNFDRTIQEHGEYLRGLLIAETSSGRPTVKPKIYRP